MAKQDLDNYPQKVLETYDFIEKLFGNGERFYETNEVMSEALLFALDDLHKGPKSGLVEPEFPSNETVKESHFN